MTIAIEKKLDRISLAVFTLRVLKTKIKKVAVTTTIEASIAAITKSPSTHRKYMKGKIVIKANALNVSSIFSAVERCVIEYS